MSFFIFSPCVLTLLLSSLIHSAAFLAYITQNACIVWQVSVWFQVYHGSKGHHRCVTEWALTCLDDTVRKTSGLSTVEAEISTEQEPRSGQDWTRNWDLGDLPSWKLIPAKSPNWQIGKGMRGLDKEFRRQIQPKIQSHKTSITPVNLEAIITCLWIMAFKFCRYNYLPGAKYDSLSLCWAPTAELRAKFSFILCSLFLWSLLSPYLQNDLNLLELYHPLQKETPPFSHWICK